MSSIYLIYLKSTIVVNIDKALSNKTYNLNFLLKI